MIRHLRWKVVATNMLLISLVLLAVVWSGYALWDNSRVYAAADNVQAGLLAFKPQPQEDNSLSFGQLRDINPDVCGWLTLDGTAIDYPVVQGESNFTYLNTDVYGSFALAGSIFLDVDCDADFSGRYSLLYGHHMADGTMFASISGYKQQWYYDAHPYFYLYTNGGTYRVDLFAGLIVPGEHEVFNTSFNDADLTRFINQSTFNAGRGIPTGRIVGMCTCSYEADNYRFVVLGEMTPLTEGNDQ